MSRPRIIHDKSELRALFVREPIQSAYLLAYLDEAYDEVCMWYGDGPPEALDGVLLVSIGPSVPTIITHGTPEAIAGVTVAFNERFPGRVHLSIQPEHLPAIDVHFACEGLKPRLRMGCQAPDFQPVDSFQDYYVDRLTHRDTAEIFAFYRHDPDNFFEPAQLGTGHYYGIRVDGRLVSVAGVHVLSRERHVACIGSIMTHPDFRSRGIGTICCSHLCARLIVEGYETLALNVGRHNRSAMRLLEKLGFTPHDTYLTGFARASAPIGF